MAGAVQRGDVRHLKAAMLLADLRGFRATGARGESMRLASFSEANACGGRAGARGDESRYKRARHP
jgi:hypothetical protein